jgi:hypothetical protein
MLLTITCTTPAADLARHLHREPGRPHTAELPAGRAHLFFPDHSAERRTAAVLLEIDPLAAPGSSRQSLSKTYTAPALVGLAVARLFAPALDAPAGPPLELTARLPALPCPAGDEPLRRLFDPLGYAVTSQRLPLDEHFPEWGDAPVCGAELRHRLPPRDLLTHLAVLLPVLDEDHPWETTQDEELLRLGGGWLAAHPERDAILRCYRGEPEPAAPDPRLSAVVAELYRVGAQRVLVLGAGEGGLLEVLNASPTFTEIVGVDVSARALARVRERLGESERVQLLAGALTYRDARWVGYDAAAAVGVVERLGDWQRAAFAQALFGHARPRAAVLTVPAAARPWAEDAARAHRYTVRFTADAGLAVFTRNDRATGGPAT